MPTKVRELEIHPSVIDKALRGFSVVAPADDGPRVLDTGDGKGGIVFAYYRKRRCVGALEVRPMSIGRFYMVQIVFVDEEYRRQGIATELFRLAESKLGTIFHSNALTADGREWVDSLRS